MMMMKRRTSRWLRLLGWLLCDMGAVVDIVVLGMLR